MSANTSLISILTLLALGLLALFLPDAAFPFRSRTFSQLLNTGHIFLVFLACKAFYTLRPGFSRRPIAFQFLFLLAGVLLLGGLAELLQGLLPGRQPSLTDVIANLAGLFLFLSLRGGRAREYLPLHLATAAALCFVLWPLLSNGLDERIAARQVPLLAGFETPFERTRFQGDATLAITREKAFQGGRSLRVTMTGGDYPGTFLTAMHGDWTGYQRLRFAVFNPNTEPALTLHVRVHDALHAQNQTASYPDRFNRAYDLQPGWNQIRIPIKDIAAAPRGRSMDLSRVGAVGFFLVSPAKPVTLYLDDISLEKTATRQPDEPQAAGKASAPCTSQILSPPAVPGRSTE